MSGKFSMAMMSVVKKNLTKLAKISYMLHDRILSVYLQAFRLTVMRELLVPKIKMCVTGWLTDIFLKGVNHFVYFIHSLKMCVAGKRSNGSVTQNLMSFLRSFQAVRVLVCLCVRVRAYVCLCVRARVCGCVFGWV